MTIRILVSALRFILNFHFNEEISILNKTKLSMDTMNILNVNISLIILSSFRA